MIITKKEFAEVLTKIKEEIRLTDKINHALRESQNETVVFSSCLIDYIISILEKIFQDEETRWIDYWVFEKDCGDKYSDGDVVDEKDNNIPFRTAEDVYELLIKNMRGKSNENGNKS